MGFWSIFGNGEPSKKAIEKQVKKAKERYAQPDYRKAAMEKLLKWNTKESITGVLGRFSVVVQSPYWDEDEKRWLVEELVKKGDLAKEPLIEFLLREHEVNYAIKALAKICQFEAELSQIVIDALKHRPPEDHRSKQAKMELIAALGEMADANSIMALVPYLRDHNDDVQCMTIDVLVAQKAAAAYPEIASLLYEPHQSARVLRHAAAAVANLNLPIDASKPLAPEVAEDFKVKENRLEPLH